MDTRKKTSQEILKLIISLHLPGSTAIVFTSCSSPIFQNTRHSPIVTGLHHGGAPVAISGISNVIPRVLSLPLSRGRKREDPGNGERGWGIRSFRPMTHSPEDVSPDF